MVEEKKNKESTNENKKMKKKKNLWTKDMTDVRTSIYLWTKDVTNIRCYVWCYWEQEFGEPMGTYLAHHWLVLETVVVNKKNTNVGWVIDFFVIPICFDYLEEKKKNERTIGFGYLKIFRIKRITGLRYLIKKNQNHISTSSGYFKNFKKLLGFMKEPAKTQQF